MGRIEVVSRNLIVVHDCTVNYDQTPSEAMEGLPNNNPDVANYPQRLWNGGESGIVEGVDISICIPRRYVTTAKGREAQAAIGYGCPAVLAALKGEDIRKEPRAEDLWALVALRQSNEQLWQFDGDYRPSYLYLGPLFHGFRLGSAAGDWAAHYGFVGAPQVPK